MVTRAITSSNGPLSNRRGGVESRHFCAGVPCGTPGHEPEANQHYLLFQVHEVRMSLSMYSSSIPVFLHYLKSLSTILKKGADYAAEKKIDEKVLTGARLFPDMFPL